MRPFLKPLAVLFLLLALPVAASAQNIGVEFGTTDAQYDEALVSPTGFRGYVDLPVFARVPVLDRAALRLSATRHTESRGITRSPCVGLPPPGTDCSPQDFESNARLTTFGAGLVVQLPFRYASVQPELYLMGTGSSVNVNFEAVNSDAEVSPVTPDGTSWGLSGGFGVTYAVTDLVGVSGRVGFLRPGFEICGADAWFAFCDERTLTRFSIGTRLDLSTLR